MRRIIVLVLLVGFAVLFQMCDDESPCGTYRLTKKGDVQNSEGGDAIFSYNADGSLQNVSGEFQSDDNFFYDAGGRLIRTEANSQARPRIILLFDYDAKGRVIAMHQDAPFVDSTAFEYDDTDRMTKAIFYRSRSEILYYYVIEYPNASTVKNSVYLRDQNTKEFVLGYTDTYTMDDHPRPHPQVYYLYRFPIEQAFLANNPLSIQTTYGGGRVITKSYTYNAGGYPVSEDDKFTYEYRCD
ncbi:hypothetical protein WBG78_00770 [Chryseolinea sp. T2]|uniref:hypothetical protein n=1 Tax=Chryseolinea sp. T2 TaxID=3129255 RepID=UPI0030788537